jgi:solute carrier family 12 (potassium/chloride transporter), member 4/6
MQNIFGVILYIRVPTIVGEAGIGLTVLIVLLCVTTTFLTILSLSAIATNGKIKKGGTYYIISRSMGAPIGTAVGFCFYLGNVVAGAMYILGATEAFITTTGWDMGDLQVSMRVIGACLWAFLIFVNLVGI